MKYLLTSPHLIISLIDTFRLRISMSSVIDVFYTLQFLFNSKFKVNKETKKNDFKLPESWLKYQARELPEILFSKKSYFRYRQRKPKNILRQHQLS